MLGRMAVRAARDASRSYGQLPPPPQGGQDRHGWIGIAVVMLLMPVAASIVISGYQGHVSGTACAVYAIGVIALTALCGVLGGIARRSHGRRVLAKYASPEQGASPADGWLGMAAQLRAAERAGLDVMTVRERRVRDCIGVLCPVRRCRATAGVTCAAVRGEPVAVLSPEVLCHLLRMKDSVRYGVAQRSDILAQFGNDVPDGIL